MLLAVVWGLVLSASVALFVHSGAFWRDELSSIMLAQLPTVTDMYANLESDSAPLLFVCLLKVWMALGPGTGSISIIDEYLEHARVFIFQNEGKEKVYISSADWMVQKPRSSRGSHLPCTG